jgi:hypothetical protein
MGTRSMIGMVQEDGSVLAIYCHWDGYVKHNGWVLDHHYGDADKVAALIALGNISSLRAEIGEQHPFDTCHLKPSEIDPRWESWTVAYGRDRGEDKQEAVRYDSVQAYADALGDNGDEYRYLFDGEAWFVLTGYGPHAGKWDDVREALKDAEAA